MRKMRYLASLVIGLVAVANVANANGGAVVTRGAVGNASARVIHSIVADGAQYTSAAQIQSAFSVSPAIAESIFRALSSMPASLTERVSAEGVNWERLGQIAQQQDASFQQVATLVASHLNQDGEINAEALNNAQFAAVTETTGGSTDVAASEEMTADQVDAVLAEIEATTAESSAVLNVVDGGTNAGAVVGRHLARLLTSIATAAPSDVAANQLTQYRQSATTAVYHVLNGLGERTSPAFLESVFNATDAFAVSATPLLSADYVNALVQINFDTAGEELIECLTGA